jgi:hypothetical protein
MDLRLRQVAVTGPRTPIRARSSIGAPGAGQMAASDWVPVFFKNRLHSGGRPRMVQTLVTKPREEQRGSSHNASKYYSPREFVPAHEMQ